MSSVKATASIKNNSPFLQIKIKALFDPGGTVANGSQWLLLSIFIFARIIQKQNHKNYSKQGYKNKASTISEVFVPEKVSTFFGKEKIILKITVTITYHYFWKLREKGLLQLIQEVITIIRFICKFSFALSFSKTKI